jgi:hypothetical protein
MVCRYTQRKGSSFDSCSQGENGEGEELSGRPGGQIVIVAALRSSRVSMGFGYMRRRCTSKAKHSSATSLGRDRDRPVRFSIRCNRWRTVFGWRVSTSAAPCTDASVSCHNPKRVEKHLPLVVGKVAKTVQRSADRFDHRLRRADSSGGQDGAVEHRDRGCGIGRAPQHHSSAPRRSPSTRPPAPESAECRCASTSGTRCAGRGLRRRPRVRAIFRSLRGA